MNLVATLLVIPASVLAFFWSYWSAKRRWLAAWIASWCVSAIAVAAMLLYVLAADLPGSLGAASVALIAAVGRGIWGPWGRQYTGRHQ